MSLAWQFLFWCYCANNVLGLGVKTQQAVIMTPGLLSDDWRL